MRGIRTQRRYRLGRYLPTTAYLELNPDRWRSLVAGLIPPLLAGATGSNKHYEGGNRDRNPESLKLHLWTSFIRRALCGVRYLVFRHASGPPA